MRSSSIPHTPLTLAGRSASAGHAAPLWLRWLLASTMGLFAALFVFASAALAVAVRFGAPESLASLVAMTLAAGAAGIVLGSSQSLVLVRCVPALPWSFAPVTGAALALAWSIGAMVANHAQLGSVSRTLVAGTLAGLLVGAAQALVLRVARPGRWIGLTALGWTVGMGAIVAGFDLQGSVTLPIIGIVAGIFAIGAITAPLVVRR